ncbi:hypothetical protein LguiA_007800 [Lonicera macranthoides]
MGTSSIQGSDHSFCCGSSFCYHRHLYFPTFTKKKKGKKRPNFLRFNCQKAFKNFLPRTLSSNCRILSTKFDWIRKFRVCIQRQAESTRREVSCCKVEILSYCSGIDFKGNEFKALVYEFMANGSLYMWLHPQVPKSSTALSLIRSVNIAIDVASAIHYLHNFCEPPIIHCDLKPSNILLDDDLTAHVGILD